MTKLRILDWALRIAAAVILGQTLFFKFSAAPESVYIFATLGAEPWGRIGSGVVELAACILLLMPRTAGYGALLAAATMLGAIASHLTLLGVTLPAVGDHGELFSLALIALSCSLGVLFLHRDDFLRLIARVVIPLH